MALDMGSFPDFRTWVAQTYGQQVLVQMASDPGLASQLQAAYQAARGQGASEGQLALGQGQLGLEQERWGQQKAQGQAAFEQQLRQWQRQWQDMAAAREAANAPAQRRFLEWQMTQGRPIQYPQEPGPIGGQGGMDGQGNMGSQGNLNELLNFLRRKKLAEAQSNPGQR